jgi:hypothetical protein
MYTGEQFTRLSRASFLLLSANLRLFSSSARENLDVDSNVRAVMAPRISAVWLALGGGPIRRGRGRAWWRGGDGWSVSVNDERSVWFDHREGHGGGVLDLITTVNGGTRLDASRWLHQHFRISPPQRRGRPSDRRRAASDEREFRRARLWASAVVPMAEHALEEIGVAHPSRTALTILLRSLLGPRDDALVRAYREWFRAEPALTSALVWAGANHERRACAIARMLLEVGA